MPTARQPCPLEIPQPGPARGEKAPLAGQFRSFGVKFRSFDVKFRSLDVKFRSPRGAGLPGRPRVKIM